MVLPSAVIGFKLVLSGLGHGTFGKTFSSICPVHFETQVGFQHTMLAKPTCIGAGEDVPRRQHRDSRRQPPIRGVVEGIERVVTEPSAQAFCARPQ